MIDVRNYNKLTLIWVLVLVMLFSACSTKSDNSPESMRESEISGSADLEEVPDIKPTQGAKAFQQITDNLLITPVQGDLASAYRGYAIVSDGSRYGLQDIYGTMLIDYTYDNLQFAKIDDAVLLIAKQGDSYGIIDTNNQVVVPIQFPYLHVYGHKYLITSESNPMIIDFTNESPLSFSILDASGKELGVYSPSEDHNTTMPISVLWHEGAADGLLCATATIYNSVRDVTNTKVFTDVILPDGTITVTGEDYDLSHVFSDPLTNYTALHTKDVNVDIGFVLDSKGIPIGGGRFFAICGWDLNGHAVTNEYNAYDGKTTYYVTGIETGDKIEELKYAPDREITDSLILFQRQVFDKDKNHLLDVTDTAHLLGDKILYEDVDTGIWHFVDKAGNNVYDERYIDFYHFTDESHSAYLLKKDDGNVIMLSENGDLLDEGNLTIDASYAGDGKTVKVVHYNGEYLELKSICNGYITFVQKNNLLVFTF